MNSVYPKNKQFNFKEFRYYLAVHFQQESCVSRPSEIQDKLLRWMLFQVQTEMTKINAKKIKL